jgi:hypothetical protein
MAHKESIALLRDVIPDLMDNAYYLVKFLQHSEDSEEELYQFLFHIFRCQVSGVRNDKQRRWNLTPDT